MVKRIFKYFFILFLMLLLITIPLSNIAYADSTDTITFARKYVAINHLFTITFNKQLLCKDGEQTIKDIEKLIVCTDDISNESIPIRASYQVDNTNQTTKLNVQISNENGQPSGILGRNYILTINKGIKAIDGTVTDKTYMQPFTINSPEAVDDDIKLMISKDLYITHPKGYVGNDWAMTYPYCSQVLMNDGTMLTNVPIKYVNGHVSGDIIQDNDISDGGVPTVLKNEGNYIYNGYPVINGVEDTKRLFSFNFQIKKSAGVQHVDSKIMVGSSDADITVYQPQNVKVQLIGGGYENKYINWLTKYNNYNNYGDIILQDNMIYENTGEINDWYVPFTYYYVSQAPDDDTIFANATKNLTTSQITALKDIQSIIGDSHWKYTSTGILLYVKNPNPDAIYDSPFIGIGETYSLKTNSSYIYTVNMNNIVGNYSFSDFQKIRNDLLVLLNINNMNDISNTISQIDTEISNTLYPLSNETNTMLQNKKFSWIVEDKKNVNGIIISTSVNTINGHIEANYNLNNGK